MKFLLATGLLAFAPSLVSAVFHFPESVPKLSNDQVVPGGYIIQLQEGSQLPTKRSQLSVSKNKPIIMVHAEPAAHVAYCSHMRNSTAPLLNEELDGNQGHSSTALYLLACLFSSSCVVDLPARMAEPLTKMDRAIFKMSVFRPGVFHHSLKVPKALKKLSGTSGIVDITPIRLMRGPK